MLHKKITPLIVSIAVFMEAVDTNIINTAIPVMARSFDVNPIDLKIALISYLLSLAIFIPISGWIADKFGIKRVFMMALALFTLSSFFCGFANTLPELVFARIIQGMGGSLTVPLGRLIIVKTFARHELIATMSRVIMVAALGMMLGPVLGGFITHYFSWRWIFWVNIPVGIFAICMAQIGLQAEAPQKVPPLDKLGFIYFGASLAAFTFSMSELSESTGHSTFGFLIMLIAVLLFINYVVHSRKRPHPIVKVELFKSHTFRVSAVGNLISRLGFGGVPFLVPLMLQISLGYPAQISGLLMAPMALGVLLVKPFSLPILRWFGFRRLLLINTILVAMTLWLFNEVNLHSPMSLICLLMFLFGFLISMQYSSMNSLAYSNIAPNILSAATSVMSTLQQLAQSFGVAAGALCLRYYSTGQTALTLNNFHHTFFTLGIITLFSAFIFVRLKPEDGAEMLAKVNPRVDG